jgi:hypothetical protein
LLSNVYIAYPTVHVLSRWQQHQEAIGAWHVVWYLIQKMKQDVMKSSTQVWLGKQPVTHQHHHPSKRIVIAKKGSPHRSFAKIRTR